MEEILHEILSEIKIIKTDIVGMKADITSMKVDMTGMKFDINNKQVGVRIEEGQPLDVCARLKDIDQKLKIKNTEINLLNDRVFKVEAEIIKLNK